MPIQWHWWLALFNRLPKVCKCARRLNSAFKYYVSRTNLGVRIPPDEIPALVAAGNVSDVTQPYLSATQSGLIGWPTPLGWNDNKGKKHTRCCANKADRLGTCHAV